MSLIITMNGLERNVGVSSVLLSLSERLNYLTNKKTCIVELDHKNPSFSFILERVNKSTKNLDDIARFLRREITNEELSNVLDHNINSFKNSSIDVIYGSYKEEELTENQLDILFSFLRNKYELILVDYGDNIIPSIMQDMSDINLLIVQPSFRYLDKLKQARWDYITNKTKIIINNSCKSTYEIEYFLSKAIEDIELLGDLPSSNTLNQSILQGQINIDSGLYNNKLDFIANKLCKLLNIDNSNKKSIFNMFKKNIREDIIELEQINKLSIEEILIEKGICSKEDIDMCYKIQASRGVS